MNKARKFAVVSIFAILVTLMIIPAFTQSILTRAAVATASPGASCNVGIPSGAVVGKLTASTAAYFTPNAVNNVGGLTLAAGKNFYVIGKDATGKFYKIALACNYLWIPVGAIGPNPESPWNGRALPGAVTQ